MAAKAVSSERRRTEHSVALIRVIRELVGEFQQRRLLTWATALSFNALWTLPPLVLLLLALAGFFDLKAAWNDHLGPDVHRHVTRETWGAIDSTVERILRSPHVVWVAIGFVLAAWHVSALVRASSGALSEILDAEDKRSAKRRIAMSVVVAVPVLVLISLAVLVVVGGRLIPVHGFAAAAGLFLARWAVAAALMWAMLAIITRAAPAVRPRARWVSAGAGLAIGGWILASIVFGLYVGYVADFRSPYGTLVSVMVLMAYLYWLSIAFLAGVLIDAMAKRRTRR
jgi:membrane protein